MENDYNFWRDLLDTYQSLPDWLKFCWLFIPAALLTLAGNALLQLVRTAAPLSPPPPPAARYRGVMGPQGEIYLEPVVDGEQGVLPSLSQTGAAGGEYGEIKK